MSASRETLPIPSIPYCKTSVFVFRIKIISSYPNTFSTVGTNEIRTSVRGILGILGKINHNAFLSFEELRCVPCLIIYLLTNSSYMSTVPLDFSAASTGGGL